MIIHFVFNLKKKVKDMKDKIKSIKHIQKDESMKVKSIKGKKQNKKPPSHAWDESLLPRYHPNLRRSAHLQPGNGGRAAMSPWKLRGEPNQASAGRLAAGDRPSLRRRFRLFSRFTAHNIPIYTIKTGEMQARNAQT